MADVTLADLARRVEALEQAIRLQAQPPGPDDWQRVVGMFAGSDLMKAVDEEGRRIREAERDQAQHEAGTE